MLLICLLLMSSAQAAEKYGKYGKPVPPPDTPYASRDQLRACIAQEDRLQALRRTTRDLEKNNQADLRAVARSGEALRRAQADVNRDDQAAVAALHQQLDEHNALATAVNQRAEAMQAKADALQAAHAAYQRDCYHLKYRIEDRKAVIQEKNQVWQE
ncbi:hypothetical protein V8J88_14610 [Massilia sp. W12]|uniref:hypothetical protein n=1 Tax=Massilia sp. W12 TaxID=3126507 RepID=UPI0030D2A8B2